MFRKLQGRRVVINTTLTESFRGTIERVGLFHVRLRDFEVLDTAGREGLGGPAEGIARVPRRHITWIQEL